MKNTASFGAESKPDSSFSWERLVDPEGGKRLFGGFSVNSSDFFFFFSLPPACCSLIKPQSVCVEVNLVDSRARQPPQLPLNKPHPAAARLATKVSEVKRAIHITSCKTLLASCQRRPLLLQLCTLSV